MGQTDLEMRPAFLLAALASIGVQGKTESDWAKSIWDDVKEAVTCASCEGLLGTLKLVAGLGQEALIRVVTDVCIISGVCLHPFPSCRVDLQRMRSRLI